MLYSSIAFPSALWPNKKKKSMDLLRFGGGGGNSKNLRSGVPPTAREVSDEKPKNGPGCFLRRRPRSLCFSPSSKPRLRPRSVELRVCSSRWRFAPRTTNRVRPLDRRLRGKRSSQRRATGPQNSTTTAQRAVSFRDSGVVSANHVVVSPVLAGGGPRRFPLCQLNTGSKNPK